MELYMAEDKGGGGWEWTTLEIILGLLLAIALIDRIQGKNVASPTPNNAVSDRGGDGGDSRLCGLFVNTPQPLENIHGYVRLTGNTDNCDWKITSQAALYAQIVDSRGKPVSAYTIVAPLDVTDGTASFSQYIPLTGAPAAGVGYLILIPATATAAPVSARIPIEFKK